MQADGFVFFEIYVADLAAYVRLFKDALGFELAEDDGDFVKLRSAKGSVLLNAMRTLPPEHPFHDFRRVPKRGFGVELGVVTTRLDEAWRAARALDGFQVTDVVTQDWGMSDFRVLTPEGYYLRVTTPDPDER
jgi:catechol 2,3-dioxygenase-like lactoylglutathione lyase family enzyme